MLFIYLVGVRMQQAVREMLQWKYMPFSRKHRVIRAFSNKNGNVYTVFFLDSESGDHATRAEKRGLREKINATNTKILYKYTK